MSVIPIPVYTYSTGQKAIYLPPEYKPYLGGWLITVTLWFTVLLVLVYKDFPPFLEKIHAVLLVMSIVPLVLLCIYIGIRLIFGF